MSYVFSGSMKSVALGVLCSMATIISGPVYTAYSQPVPGDFETISIGMQAVHSMECLHEFWEQELGIEGFARLPLFAGAVQAGMQFAPFKCRLHNKPDFDSLILYGQYDRELVLPYGLIWSIGGRLSMMKMTFSGEGADHTGDMEEEQEFGLGAVTRLSYPVSKCWHMHVEMTYTRIYTAKPIDMKVVGIGLGRTFDTPRLLREFLW